MASGTISTGTIHMGIKSMDYTVNGRNKRKISVLPFQGKSRLLKHAVILLNDNDLTESWKGPCLKAASGGLLSHFHLKIWDTFAIHGY